MNLVRQFTEERRISNDMDSLQKKDHDDHSKSTVIWCLFSKYFYIVEQGGTIYSTYLTICFKGKCIIHNTSGSYDFETSLNFYFCTEVWIWSTKMRSEGFLTKWRDCKRKIMMTGVRQLFLAHHYASLDKKLCLANCIQLFVAVTLDIYQSLSVLYLFHKFRSSSTSKRRDQDVNRDVWEKWWR